MQSKNRDLVEADDRPLTGATIRPAKGTRPMSGIAGTDDPFVTALVSIAAALPTPPSAISHADTHRRDRCHESNSGRAARPPARLLHELGGIFREAEGDKRRFYDLLKPALQRIIAERGTVRVLEFGAGRTKLSPVAERTGPSRQGDLRRTGCYADQP